MRGGPDRYKNLLVCYLRSHCYPYHFHLEQKTPATAEWIGGLYAAKVTILSHKRTLETR